VETPYKPNHERREPSKSVCIDHSGMVERDNAMTKWLEGIFALLIISTGLLSYSVLWQGPNIRADIAKEIARIDKENVQRDMKIQNIESAVTEIRQRVNDR